MDEKNLKIIRYLTGTMFGVSFIMALLQILLKITGYGYYLYCISYESIPYGVMSQFNTQFTWIYSKRALLFEMAALLVLAVGMFAGRRTLLPVGAGIYCLAYVVDAISTNLFNENILFCLLTLFSLAGYVFFALSVGQRESSTRYALVSIIILFVSRLVFYWFELNDVYFSIFDFIFSNLYQTTVAAVSIFLTSIVLQNTPRDCSSTPMKQISKTAKADHIEELTKLKDLLDAGAITQEEFDAKKKQILWM